MVDAGKDKADHLTDEVLLKTKEVVTLQRPSKKDYESVRNWFIDVKPLVDEEFRFIKRKEDIVTLRTGRECAAFDSLVERALSGIDGFLVNRCRCKIIRVRYFRPVHIR